MGMLLGSSFVFLYVNLKLDMYKTGVPRDCVVVLYLGCGVELGVVGSDGVCCMGDGVWYVFGGKTIVICRSAFFNILNLIWYLSWNLLMKSMHVGYIFVGYKFHYSLVYLT